MPELTDFIEKSPTLEILNSFLTTQTKIKNYENIVCAISGGSDSDIILDICAKLDKEKKIKYVFFDTGLEFQATKNHIKELQEKYGVEIKIIRAIKPIPLCCRQHGVPFLSKYVSEMIERLQRYGFKWEDAPFDELYKKYPKCKAALRWWCNEWDTNKFCISRNSHLKEFLIENPPDFNISPKCCNYAKKLPASKYKKEIGCDLSITGIRKAEGGIRSVGLTSCFSDATRDRCAEYRPIFWYKKDDKEAYKKEYSIKHSACYEVWGLTRTGCSGCPFAVNLEEELRLTKVHEPKLYNALYKVFGKSYEYTRRYREFQKERRASE